MGFRYLGEPNTLFRLFGKPSGTQTPEQYLRSLMAQHNAQGFILPLSETSGTVAYDVATSPGGLNGTHSGDTLGGDTFMGNPAPTFDAVNDQVLLPYDDLEPIVNPENADWEWSFGCAYRMDEATTQDGNYHPFLVIGVDIGNRIILYKNNTADRITFLFPKGGVNRGITDNSVVEERYDVWNRIVGTINTAQNRMRLYINQQLIGERTLVAGTWTASALTQAFCSVGANDNGIWMLGSLALAFGFNYEMTAAEIAHLDDLIVAREDEAA